MPRSAVPLPAMGIDCRREMTKKLLQKYECKVDFCNLGLYAKPTYL